MILEDSLRAVEGAHFGPGFVRPLYDSYCFSQVPRLVQALFEEGEDDLKGRLLGPLAGRYDVVVLLLIDGFGWRFLCEHENRYPFLARFAREGVVTKLTSQFPSTTSAHITCIHTGLTPAESGVYEWFVYEPDLGGVIETLPFQRIGRRSPGSLLEEGVSPETIFPTRTIHQALARRGIPSNIVQSSAFTPSPFSNAVMSGARLHPYGELEDGIRQLSDLTATAPSGYFYLYAGELDTAGHRAGPDSHEFRAEVERCFTRLEAALPSLSRGPGRRLLLMTADHGQVKVDPNGTLFLNRSFPQAEAWTQTDPRGTPLLPSGNARDMVLHIRPERLAEAQARLADHLAGQAEVWRVDDMLSQGFFGSGAPSDVFLRRIGNLMVLPLDDRLTWWEAPNYTLGRFFGQHGGLSAAEMETELLALEL